MQPTVSGLGFFKAQAATSGDTAQGVFTAGPQVLEGSQVTVDQRVQGRVQLRQTVPPYGERVEYGMRELPAVEDANRTFIDQLRCKRWIADRGIDLSRLPQCELVTRRRVDKFDVGGRHAAGSQQFLQYQAAQGSLLDSDPLAFDLGWRADIRPCQYDIGAD